MYRQGDNNFIYCRLLKQTVRYSNSWYLKTGAWGGVCRAAIERSPIFCLSISIATLSGQVFPKDAHVTSSVPAPAPLYKPPVRPNWAALVDALENAGTQLTRLDERLERTDPVLASGIKERIAYREAHGALWLAGAHVLLDDLVLYDVDARRGDPDLYRAYTALRDYRSFTRSIKPTRNLLSDANLALLDGRPKDRLTQDRLNAWRTIVAESEGWPRLLRAATAWQAWRVLEPFLEATEPLNGRNELDAMQYFSDKHVYDRAAWIGAALLLLDKSCSVMPPVLSGLGSFRPRSNLSFEQHAAGFMSWIATSSEAAYRELHRLTLARTVMLQAIGKRRSSHHAHNLALSHHG